MKHVVGAAILRDGRVLTARRTAPPAAAGRWEFPGGKVEAGESADGAVVREVDEELGCLVEVTGWLDAVVAINDGLQLRVATARLIEGEPQPAEHDAVRWLAADELEEVEWLEPDRPFLPQLRQILTQPQGAVDAAETVRAVLFEPEDAQALAARVRADGFSAEVLRERLAGEDDDEDHPWAVITDAPEFLVELLVEEYDGWLDTGNAPAADVPALPPLTLPDAPKRIKRPGLG